MAVSPTIDYVKTINKLTRHRMSQSVKLPIWQLAKMLRIIGFLDVSYRNNKDGLSQRGMTVLLAKSRERSSKGGMS